MKKLILLLLTFALMASCQESLEDRCAKEAKSITEKNCPYRIDDSTTMDSMTFDRTTHTIHYYYRLTGAADSVGLQTNEGAKAVLLKSLKNSTSMLAYKDAGYNIAYTYFSQKHPGTVLIDVLITEKDYK